MMKNQTSPHILLLALCLALGGCATGDEAEDSQQGTKNPVDLSDAGTTEPSEEPGIRINEISPSDPDSADWFELTNTSDESIDVGEWTYVDSNGDHGTNIAPDTLLAPGEYIVFTRDVDFDFGLGGSDDLYLFDAAGEMVDVTSWSADALPEGMTWGRDPDGTGDFTALPTPTKGTTNSPGNDTTCGDDTIEAPEVCDGTDTGSKTCVILGYFDGTPSCDDTCSAFDTSTCNLPTSKIVLNEVSSAGEDPIELVNTGTASVTLTGWRITDESPEEDGHVFEFPEGTTLEAGGYLSLIKGAHHSFGLGNKDSVFLYNDQDVLMDQLVFANGDATVSYCRTPDSTGPFAPCQDPSIGSANP